MKLFCEHCAKAIAVVPEPGKNSVPCPECSTELPLPAEQIAPGVVLGDFLIESIISSGGMGVVYLARQLSLDRHVALKVLQSKYTGDKEYVNSLFREARAAAKISHPNVVQAYAIGEDDGVFYFAMEYIRGNTFKEILKEKGGKLEFVQAAQVVRDIARALAAAWREQKLIHQDIKPDNIMLDANGFAKLADLGLAKSVTNNCDVDNADEVLGTPQYISPEQLTGVPSDVRSDIYSLGATFFQFVTGRYPYVADSAEEITRMHVAGNLEAPKKFNPELPEVLNQIIVKMMARKPEERYQTPEELVDELNEFLLDSRKQQSQDKKAAAAPSIPAFNIPGTGGKNAANVPKLKFNNSPAASASKPAAAPAPVKSLSLNLPGKNSGGQTVVQSKPVVPQAVPAAAPAAAAAKPAVPPAAKPVVPQTAPTAVPAAPAAKPAVPPAAKPVVPQAAPVASPAAAAAKSAVPPAAKPVNPPAAVKEPAAKPAAPAAENKKTQAKVKPAAKPAGRGAKSSGEPVPAAMLIGRIVKWIFLGLLALLLLTAAFVTTVVILHKKEKLPKFLDPVANFLFAQAGAAKEKALELAKPTEIAPEVPTGPVTRPEYMNLVQELLDFRQAQPEARNEFLTRVDKHYLEIIAPQTEEERELFQRFIRAFSTTDEQFRCDSGREALRKEFSDKLAVIEAARRKAEELRQQQIALEQKRKEEREIRAKELDELNRQEQKQRLELLKQLKTDCFKHGETIASKLVTAALTQDRTELDAALENAANFVAVTVIQSAEEKAIFAKLTGFLRDVDKEYNALLLYQKRLANISKRHNLYLTMHNSEVALVEGISPDGIRCRTSNEVMHTVKFHQLPVSSRNSFSRVMAHRFKQLPAPGFYLPLLEQHVDAVARKHIPASGFWKNYSEYFLKTFKK